MEPNNDIYMNDQEYQDFINGLKQNDDNSSEVSSDNVEEENKNGNVEYIDNYEYNKKIYNYIRKEILRGMNIEQYIEKMKDNSDVIYNADCSN